MDNSSTKKPNRVNDQPYPWFLFSTLLLWLPAPLFFFFVFCGNVSGIAQRIVIGGLIAFGLLIYALFIRKEVICELLDGMFQSKTANLVAMIAAFCFNWILFAILSIRKKKPLALALTAVMLGLFCFSSLGHFQKFQWVLQYYTTIGIVSMICACCAIIVLNGGISRKFAFSLIPLVILVALHSALHIRRVLIQRECSQIKSRISAMVGGYPTETADYRRLVESGSSVEDEPLKSLISSGNGIDADEFPQDAAAMSEVQEKYAAFTEKHSDFVAAVRETVKNTPQRVAHEWKDDIYSTLLPELGAFRRASRFLAMEMKAKATDRNLIAADNNAMIQMRDCMLENAFFISRLVGIAIEALRIDALAFTLPYNIYTMEEFEALLGEPPNWNLRMAQAWIDETIAHDNIKDYLLKKPYSLASLWGGDENETTNVFRYGGFIYSAFRGMLDYDVLLGWRFAERDIGFALAEKRSYPELEALVEKSIAQMKRSGAIFCTMLYPSMKSGLKKMDHIADTRRMAILAWCVSDYRHSHDGALPESLEVFGDVPVDSVNGRPFEYRHGDLEYEKTFGGTIRFSGFRIAYQYPDSVGNSWRDPSVSVPIE